MAMPEQIRHDAMQALRPPPATPLAAWIEENVHLPQAQSATPGRMRLYTYQRGICEALDDPGVREIVVRKSARIGFTAILAGYLGHSVAVNPAPILVAQPTTDDARAFSVDVEQIFEASPNLRGLISDGADESGRSTMMRRLFSGGSLEFLSASSPRAFRRKLGKIAVADEIDAYEVSDEGHVLDLLKMRTQTFRDRKLIYGGTPIFAGGTVSRLFDDSDQRIFEVRCVECSGFAEITWADLKFDPSDLSAGVQWGCPNCGCLVPEARKIEMIENGRWRATAPENTARAGFRINTLISPHANAAWPKLVEEFLRARKDPAQLQAFTNLVLGEPWQETGEGVVESELSRVSANLENIPSEILYLTGGCDVQHDRLELSSIGWDAEGRGIVLEHVILWGSPLENGTWIGMAELIARRFKHPLGGQLAYDRVLIDSGDGRTVREVYAFARGRAPLVFASKGVSGWRQPPVSLGRASDKTVRLQLVGADAQKEAVHRNASSGSLKFSDELPPVYFEQIGGEEIRTRFKRGFQVREWFQISGRRSEALDCAALAFAAKHLIHWQPDRRAEELSSAAAPRKAPAVIRSKFLGG
ncbi:phage terminase large subunit family protein [Frigidibacter sp. MR17.24]|uniref:phage terminase large subunit family protein n=1 Tax=Frigidibacter sp. MR17.24 TaxID=3127345 RepID=UPI003012AD9E